MLSETYSLDWIGVTGYLAYYEWCLLHRSDIISVTRTTRLGTEIVIRFYRSLVTIRKHCTKSVESGVSGTGAGANWKFERARPLSSTRGRVQTSDRHFTRPAPSPAALALFSFHLFQILFAPFVNLRVPHRQPRITFSDLVLSRV